MAGRRRALDAGARGWGGRAGEESGPGVTGARKAGAGVVLADKRSDGSLGGSEGEGAALGWQGPHIRVEGC